MDFDVAELIKRAGRTRQAQIVLAPIIPTKAQQQALQRIYVRVINEWGRLVPAQIMPGYERALSEMVSDAPDDINAELAALSGALSRLVVTLDAELEDWTVRVEAWHRGRFGQLFTPTGVKIDTLLGQGDVARTLQSVLAENTALIRSLDDQLRNGISGAVFRGLTNRTPAATVAREIREVAAIGRRRAELIAADQLQKLTGRLDQERQQQVGIKKFEWVHSRKAKPRPEHVVRNGKIYAWTSAVAKTDPPGRAIRCGCRAKAVVEI
jgi:SPP1 gp7 family putative phage head morphogenesis protein